jgi:hypothetical protein
MGSARADQHKVVIITGSGAPLYESSSVQPAQDWMMRIVITAVMALAIAGLTFSADAATSNKKKQRSMANKERQAEIRARDRTRAELGYDSVPDHYPVGTRAWWNAMEREGRGGFINSP